MTTRAVTVARVIRISAALLLLLAVVMTLSVLIGPADIPLVEQLRVLLGGWHAGAEALDPTERAIILSVRLPRVIFAALVGAALSTTGVLFQALLRNPLADPYVLGISGGAAVGAIIGIMTGVDGLPLGIPALAFSGALCTMALVYAIAGAGRALSSNMILLTGVIVNAFFSAVIMFLVSISSSTELHSITFWLMGDLSLATGRQLILVATAVLGGFAVVFGMARELNLIVVGDETAVQLGVEVERTKVVLFLAGSLMTGIAVSVGGVIGFVGLVIPHLMRMLFGSDHRVLLPAALLFGAAFLVGADTIARTAISHSQLPVGVVTALCGAPYFVMLLRRKRF